LPTQRFEGTTLDEAVQAAVRQLGPAAKIIRASTVRKGGLGGFFSREHVEVEVDTGTASGPSPSGHAVPVTEAPTASPGVAKAAPAPRQPSPSSRSSRRQQARPEAVDLNSFASSSPFSGAADDGPSDDPLTDLISEMADSGPSSVLDLAERVNVEQGHFGLVEDSFGLGTPSPVPEQPSDFAAVLARIVRDSGVGSSHLGQTAEHGTGDPRTGDPRTGVATDEVAASVPPAQHAGRILNELDGPEPLAPVIPMAPERRPAGPHLPAPQAPAAFLAVAAARDHAALPISQGARSARHLDGGDLSTFGLALRSLGLPLPTCHAVMAATTWPSLEAELCRALRALLPALPITPRSSSSVVAVIGPKSQVMTTARALAADMGSPVEDIALATQRKVWRQQDNVISSPDAANEQRRAWRWRSSPSVVVIEHDVRPGDATWAIEMLEALEPTLCWGVVAANHKPEDVAAWSRSLGGLDLIALVDLDATTTPAAALATSVPVGRLDGQPATPESWARVLCGRLMS
jgi:hypothetical protein